MNSARWHELMERWGASENDSVFEELKSVYSKSHRHYHTVGHINDCLRQFARVAELAYSLDEVELALWFHDAIYKPMSSTNELDSAEWAVRFLQTIGGSPNQCERVHSHIMATKHTGATLSGDTAVLVDIDVSILGRDSEEYDVYEASIRKEYRWVPGLIYRRKRNEILESCHHCLN